MNHITLFGLPTVLADLEAALLIEDLTHLWQLTYSELPGDLEADLSKCRKFFDPSLRGFTLRQRLSDIETTPASVYQRMHKKGVSLVVDVGENRLIVGVEARLALGILRSKNPNEDHVVIAMQEVMEAEGRALQLYRTWCMGKLIQTVDLSAGTGKEVLQAPSVGLVIALLINRSTTPETAIIDYGESSEGALIDQAIHHAAIRFAETIASGRKKSSSEHKLTGGYILSEARRRLAHRLVTVPQQEGSGRLLYVPAQYQDEVIRFIGKDLARRPQLTEAKLRAGIAELVRSFRAIAEELAYQSMVHERPADTIKVTDRIVSAYADAHVEQERAQ
ncbi:hypothetical protein ACTWPT_42700 [Nonomuraea sp. 3N208]|uniref:hypothetical protein n=1 Tax=Nonomuraea sp. 3N208 TaxID=3457421 RepID=UPI003FD52FA4